MCDYQNLLNALRLRPSVWCNMFFISNHVLLKQIPCRQNHYLRALSRIRLLRLEEFVAGKHWLIDVDNAWASKLKDERQNCVLFARQISRSIESPSFGLTRACKARFNEQNSEEFSVRIFIGNEILRSRLKTIFRRKQRVKGFWGEEISSRGKKLWKFPTQTVCTKN